MAPAVIMTIALFMILEQLQIAPEIVLPTLADEELFAAELPVVAAEACRCWGSSSCRPGSRGRLPSRGWWPTGQMVPGDVGAGESSEGVRGRQPTLVLSFRTGPIGPVRKDRTAHPAGAASR